jgi:TPR repeat protein
MQTKQKQLLRSDINKARFCRQYFIELKQFLSDFDISNKEGEDYANSLNMHFLLDDAHSTYVYKPKPKEELTEEELWENTQIEREKQKKECFWQLGVIDEKDLMIAIEEFFFITSQTQSLKTKQENLLDCLFNMDGKSQMDFDDDTSFAIFTYFGIIKDSKAITIGKQSQAFLKFLNNGAQGEYRYYEAFKLFKLLRNFKQHHGKLPYRGDTLLLFHKFIVFTLIGVVYICRRLWQDNATEQLLKEKGGYQKPDAISEFKIPEDVLDVIIRTEEGPIIESCRYKIGNNDWEQVRQPQPLTNEIKFQLQVRKYESFEIEVYCQNRKSPFHLRRVLNYYSWYLVLDVNIPQINPIYKGIGGGNKEVEDLFSKIIDAAQKNIDEKLGDCVKEAIGKMEPLFHSLRESDEMENIMSEKVISLLEDLRKELKNGNRREESTPVLAKIEENNRFLKLLVDAERKREKRVYLRKCALAALPFLLTIGTVLSCVFLKDLSNLLWLQYKWIIIPIAILLPITTLGAFLWINKRSMKTALKDIGSKQWGGIFFIVMCLIGAYMLLPYHDGKNYIEDYEFYAHDSLQNSRAVAYMEDYLKAHPDDEEMTRIRLVEYYVDFTYNINKAKEVSEKMLDVRNYEKGALTAMGVLYLNQDFGQLKDYIGMYEDIYGEEDPYFCDLKGAFLCDTLCGTRDVKQGMELLRKSVKGGCVDACYNLGYLLSHDESTFEALDEGKEVQNSYYDLIGAIDTLRMACEEIPRAALILGDIYSELNMEDSATHYYKKALDNSGGNLYKLSLYKAGILADKFGVKPNEPLILAKTYNYSPALLFSSIKINCTESQINQFMDYEGTLYDAFLLLFKQKDHRESIRLFNQAMKHREGAPINDLGIYQYVAPIVFDYAFLGDTINALNVLKETRPKGKFNRHFINALQMMIGTPKIAKDSIAALEQMRISASQGCLYAEMFCHFRDAEKTLKENPSATVDLKFFSQIAQEIPFASVLESILRMKTKEYKKAENSARYAMWRKHPAGAFMFDCFPMDYYDNNETGIFNGKKKKSIKELYDERKLQETALRMTWNDKRRSLLFSYKLDREICERLNDSFENRFKFWVNAAIANQDFQLGIALLNEYKAMIKKGYVDNDMIGDALLRATLDNMTEEFRTPQNVTFLRDLLDNYEVFPDYYMYAFVESYGEDRLKEKLHSSVRSYKKGLTLEYATWNINFIDDFSLLNEFTYMAGPYAYNLRGGNNKTIITQYLTPQTVPSKKKK